MVAVNTPATNPQDRAALDAAHRKLEEDARAALDRAHRELEERGVSAALSIAVGPSNDPDANKRADAAAELKAAREAHEPLDVTDARAGATVCLKPGERVDSTQNHLIGAVDGSTIGRVLATANPGATSVNVEWPDQTWSVVPLAHLELVEEAPPAPGLPRPKSTEPRLLAVEAAVSAQGSKLEELALGYDGRLSAVESSAAELKGRIDSASAAVAAGYVTKVELAELRARIDKLEAAGKV